MSEENSIHVNFGKPMPIFPLDSVKLLPQQLLPLHIFEPRYKQMIDHAIDGCGQIALAVFQGDRWKLEYHGSPPIRPAVCLGQIIQHEKLSDGRYNLLVQGVCRAKVVREIKPDAETLYRRAILEPIGIEESDESRLYGVRERLTELLGEEPLTQLAAAEWVVERIRNEEIPTAVILELVSFSILSDRELRYRLLAEADPSERADLVEHELLSIRHLLTRAAAQHAERWPKGVSWN